MLARGSGNLGLRPGPSLALVSASPSHHQANPQPSVSTLGPNIEMANSHHAACCKNWPPICQNVKCVELGINRTGWVLKMWYVACSWQLMTQVPRMLKGLISQVCGVYCCYVYARWLTFWIEKSRHTVLSVHDVEGEVDPLPHISPLHLPPVQQVGSELQRTM